MSKSIHHIIYVRDRIHVNYGISVETSVVYSNSPFPSFLMDKQNGVIVLRCTGLYLAFLKVFLQVLLHLLQFFFPSFLQPIVRYRPLQGLTTRFYA